MRRREKEHEREDERQQKQQQPRAEGERTTKRHHRAPARRVPLTPRRRKGSEGQERGRKGRTIKGSGRDFVTVRQRRSGAKSQRKITSYSFAGRGQEETEVEGIVWHFLKESQIDINTCTTLKKKVIL